MSETIEREFGENGKLIIKALESGKVLVAVLGHEVINEINTDSLDLLRKNPIQFSFGKYKIAAEVQPEDTPVAVKEAYEVMNKCMKRATKAEEAVKDIRRIINANEQVAKMFGSFCDAS